MILGKVWTTYQAVLEQIMLAKGDNTFKLPHLRKATNSRRGWSIVRALPVSQAAWDAAHSRTGGGGAFRNTGRRCRVVFTSSVVSCSAGKQLM